VACRFKFSAITVAGQWRILTAFPLFCWVFSFQAPPKLAVLMDVAALLSPPGHRMPADSEN